MSAHSATYSLDGPGEAAWLQLSELLLELGPAPCQQSDPEAWFPSGVPAAMAAARACDRCPVQAECLAYAVAADERHGVWGGRAFDRHLSKSFS